MHPILLPYIPVADMIARTFGETCEVLLHDLTTPTHSVVHVANNRVTGRQIGESFLNLVPKALLQKQGNEPFVANHYAEYKGRLIRSSSLLIYDEANRPVGAMCVNVDCSATSDLIRALEKTLPGLVGAKTRTKSETPAPVEGDRSVKELVYGLIDKAVEEASEPVDTKERRLALIRFLNDRGIFLMRGAVERVADRLGISKVTVYSYLDEVRRKA